MIELVPFGEIGEVGEAIAVVGVVLVEALVLYVGYGALTRLAKPQVEGMLTER